MSKKTPIPTDTFVELDADLIDEGKFRRQLDLLIRKAYRDLMDREAATGDPTGKAVVKAKITITRSKSEQYFDISYEMIHAVTPSKRTTLVKGAGGHLICPPSGSSKDDPMQLLLFDMHGNSIATIDANTGEVIEDDVPLKIGDAG